MSRLGARGAEVVKDESARWDTVEVMLVGDFDDRHVTVVYRNEGSGGWEPWVAVAESAALRRRGLSGKGLYTLRALAASRPTAIGRTRPSRISGHA
ncbi:hypothetical protein AB1Y20_010350 [Prymnesium parvum]|uniref:Uncharacterized protein n=1 Tax=Prymnesium parvum TaxID=97485 RepID=A0AB34K8P5_PRYPA